MLSKDFARGLGQLRELIAANPGDALLAHLVTRKMEAYLDQKDGYESASAVAGLVELFPQPPTRMRIVAEISQLCLHSLTAAPLERVPVYQRIQQLESQLS